MWGKEGDIFDPVMQIWGTLYDLQSLWDQCQVEHWYEALGIMNGMFAREVASMVRLDGGMFVVVYFIAIVETCRWSSETFPRDIDGAS